MLRALYSAASGMTAQQLNVDNIAHNLANANTTGFKARRAQFQDLIYQTMVQPGSASGQQTIVPTGLQVGLGTRTSSNEILFTQGSFSQTDNPLDLVIQGKGFFQIRQPSGELSYTRSGAFHLDKDGNVVPLGDPVYTMGMGQGEFYRVMKAFQSMPNASSWEGPKPSVASVPDDTGAFFCFANSPATPSAGTASAYRPATIATAVVTL